MLIICLLLIQSQPQVNNRNTRTMCEICSELTIKIPEQPQWRRSGIFIVKFQHISHLLLVFFIVNFEQLNADCDVFFEKVFF